MKTVIVLLFVALCSASKQGIVTLHGPPDTLHIDGGPCPEYPLVIEGYRDAMYNFCLETYKHIAPRGTYQFVMSPHSMWMTLAAMAEGADFETQHQLFKLLLLPSDPCIRQKYYELAASRFSFTTDVNIVSNRALVIDDGVTVNPIWHNFVKRNSLLEVMTAPIKFNPAVAANKIRQVVYAKFPRLNLRGNSVLLDTMDYNGLWNTAFADAVVKRAPFYSLSGNQTGTVDMMTVKRQGRIGYLPSVGTKIVEIPVGANKQYSILIAMSVENTDFRPVVGELKSTIFLNALASLRETKVPIEIALPQYTINSELDVKTILEDIGVTSLWTDPEATRYISNPPALPSSYVQRASMTLNKHGINPPQITELRSFGSPPSLEDSFWSEFIANKPFMLGLFDTETYTCLISSMYSQPTYPN